MIFSPTYDDALWFMVKADKTNRKNIYGLLVSLPNQLIYNIRDAIFLYNNEPFYEEYYEDSIGDTFYFSLENGVLTITKSQNIIKEHCQIMLFKLELKSLDITNVNKKSKCWLGNVNIYKNEDFLMTRLPKTTYELRKNNLRYQVDVSQDYLLVDHIAKKQHTYIVKERIPQNITYPMIREMTKNPMRRLLRKKVDII